MVRTMKERLWLPVKELRVDVLGKRQEGRRNEMAIVINAGSFALLGMTLTRGAGGGLSVNNLPLNGRFLDVPLCRRRTPEAVGWPLLEEMLLVAILRRWRPWFLKCLTDGADRAELIPWKPEEWGGKTLMVPVDFVKVFKLHRALYDVRVFGHVQVGRHLVFWDVLLFDGEKFALDGCGYLAEDASGNHVPFAPFSPDGGIAKILAKMWRRMPAFRETIRRTTSTVDDGSVFAFATRNARINRYNIDVVPPRLHFFDGQRYVPAEPTFL